MSKLDAIGSFALFYVSWFMAVFLAPTSYGFAAFSGPAVLILFLCWRGLLNSQNTLLACAITCVGSVFDGLLIHLGLVNAVGDSIGAMPYWLISIWLSFAFSMLALGHTLRAPFAVAAVLGLVMGPLSYKSGEAFGVLEFESSTTLIIYGVFWALAFPLILTLTKRFP